MNDVENEAGFAGIVGHARPLRVLRSTLASGRAPHAYLFWGPEGIGKELAVRATAAVLLCRDPEAVGRSEPCRECPSCRKTRAGNHPDLHWVVAKGASIPVDAVRALQETLSFQAFERGRKVAIIRDAFRMTREASNALLKTLEEPPLGTHLFLLAHHRNQLLPTLVSRCQGLRFDPLSRGEVEQVLASRGLEAPLAEKLAAVSGGSPGAVLAEEPEELLSLLGEAEDAWAVLNADTASERLRFSSRWAGDKEGLGRRLEALERALRERAAGPTGASAGDDRALASLSGVLLARRFLDQNVNVQLALDALFLGLLGETLEGSP